MHLNLTHSRKNKLLWNFHAQTNRHLNENHGVKSLANSKMSINFYRLSKGLAWRFGGLARYLWWVMDIYVHLEVGWNDFMPQFSWRHPVLLAWKIYNNLFLSGVHCLLSNNMWSIFWISKKAPSICSETYDHGGSTIKSCGYEAIITSIIWP